MGTTQISIRIPVTCFINQAYKLYDKSRQHFNAENIIVPDDIIWIDTLISIINLLIWSYQIFLITSLVPDSQNSVYSSVTVWFRSRSICLLCIRW